jgi:hypothetical protein
MSRTIRFHLDENCDPRIAAGLRQRGIDVTTTSDAGLLHAPDDAHIAFAVSEHRLIFTQDADFLRMNAAGIEHPGIAYCAPGSRSLGDVVRMLVLIWELLGPEEMHNRVEFL